MGGRRRKVLDAGASWAEGGAGPSPGPGSGPRCGCGSGSRRRGGGRCGGRSLLLPPWRSPLLSALHLIKDGAVNPPPGPSPLAGPFSPPLHPPHPYRSPSRPFFLPSSTLPRRLRSPPRRPAGDGDLAPQPCPSPTWPLLVKVTAVIPYELLGAAALSPTQLLFHSLYIPEEGGGGRMILYLINPQL